ncbi:EF-hand domain-containing protein [Mesorhizobium qingshengii]|uniref:EF-hand domain-containing protein n=1 Tax=Mesorhizobium qingshengii TaxID=1165689 RepID=A0ABT4R4M8_9HYPH|nr:EF-hand domain-containing protein [Mesorhizobium qingshengii]MCZ8548716.1 EF-hand domain-containing protein [Mesorhizobium qingshengii]
MKRSTKLTLSVVAALGLAAVAVPVIAQQMQHGGMMGDGMGMVRGHGGMMGSGMGTMMGDPQSYVMATFDTNKDGTLSPEEMTAGIQAELKTYDTDANGKLSLEEFAVMHAAHTRPMTVRAFQMHDADGDAQVTEAEMAAMDEMMQSHMAGRQVGMPGIGKGMMDNN